MAKVIGAEGQRALSHNLRREEERNKAQNRQIASSRIALGNQLEKMSMDSDIDDPSLGYLAGAVQADPTGIAGGIAQAFGAVKRTKAMEQKKSAIRGRTELEASIIQDNLKNLYGEDAVSELNERMDPEGVNAKDPRFWNAISKNLLAQESKSRQDELDERARTLYEQKVQLNESNLEEKELRNAISFGNYIANEENREETARQKENYEKAKPAMVNHLRDLYKDDDGNLDPSMEALIEWVATNPKYMADHWNQNILKKQSDKEKGDLWDFNPHLQELYPDRNFFMNLEKYPPNVVQHIVQRSVAQSAIPQYQQLSQQLHSARQGLGGASFDIVGQAEAAAFPVSETIDGQNVFTVDYMEWYNKTAQEEMGYESDFDVEDDGVEKVFTDLRTKMQGQVDTGMPNEYVRQKADQARTAGTYDDMVGGYQNSLLAPHLADIDTLNKKIIDLKQRYPGLPLEAVPRYESDKIQQAKGRTLPPGSVFQGTNGGYYITLGKPGQGAPATIEGLSVPFAEDQAGFESRTGSPFGFNPSAHSRGGLMTHGVDSEFPPLEGGESLDADTLRQRGVPVTMWGMNNSYGGGKPPKNAGYRELTAKEVEMVKMMNSQLMLTGNAEQSSEAPYSPPHIR
mgnify:FL=1